MALPMPVGEEGKMLSEALGIVKIQTQQMKRFLVIAALSISQRTMLTLHRIDRKRTNLWMR